MLNMLIQRVTCITARAIVDDHASNVLAAAPTEATSRGGIITVKALKIHALFDAAPPQLRKHVARTEWI